MSGYRLYINSQEYKTLESLLSGDVFILEDDQDKEEKERLMQKLLNNNDQTSKKAK